MSERLCSIEGCVKPTMAKGLCKRCYYNKRYTEGKDRTATIKYHSDSEYRKQKLEYGNSQKSLSYQKEYRARPEVKKRIRTQARERRFKQNKPKRDWNAFKLGAKLFPELFGFWKNGVLEGSEQAKAQTKHNTEYLRKMRFKRIIELGGKCQVCGYNKSMASLDIHHLHQKDVKKTSGGNRNSWAVRSKPADKNRLKLLCANCHRELHRPGLDLKELKKKYADI